MGDDWVGVGFSEPFLHKDTALSSSGQGSKRLGLRCGHCLPAWVLSFLLFLPSSPLFNSPALLELTLWISLASNTELPLPLLCLAGIRDVHLRHLTLSLFFFFF